MTTVVEVVLAVHRSLDAARISHAFGGALALAYAVGEPRGTIDVDLNAFVKSSHARRVLEVLPDGVRWSDDDVARAVRDGQVRVHWDEVPLDLFLDYHPFHGEAAGTRIDVPFADTVIPVLAPDVLAVFKAFFNRTKDWADIEAMVEAESIDVIAVRTRLVDLLGDEDHRVERLDQATETRSVSTSLPHEEQTRRGTEEG
jgi:hypothetical protein